MEAVRQARFLREMIQHRDVLIGQIVWLYSRRPYATQELRELVVRTNKDPALADRIVMMVKLKTQWMEEPKTPPGNGQ